MTTSIFVFMIIKCGHYIGGGVIITSSGYPTSDPLFRCIPDNSELSMLCKDFGLGDLIINHGDLGGLFNVNLKIETTKGLYVIRVTSGLSSEQHIKYTQRVISALQIAKIPVLAPLPNLKGNYYSKYKERFVQITPYIHAQPFESTVAHIKASGRILRKMHDALIHFESGSLPEWSNYPSTEILTEGLTLLQDICKVPDGQLSRVKQLYERIMREWDDKNEELPSTIIHGDWHVWNSLHDSDGEIIVVMDFDSFQRAERIHDIAYMLWVILPDRQSNYLGKAFLQGYGVISQAEKNLLPVAIARASLFFLCTASFTPDPAQELVRQLENQEPFIEWLLSADGRSEVKGLFGC